MWVVRKVFEKYYGNFIYPFEKVDEKRYNLSPAGQYRYLMDVNSWVESVAFKNELEELIRKFYQELSIKANDDILKTAYRLILIFLQNYESRLLTLQQEFVISEKIEKEDKQLK